MAKKGTIARGVVSLEAQTASFITGMNQAGNSIKRIETLTTRMVRTFRNIGVYSGLAIVTRGAVNAAKEMASLSVQVENVGNAFDRLEGVTLQDLQRATMGLVDNLTLMQQAVKFENFGLPVEQLGKFLQFANIRAQETGESVDWLVDSIVVGLGRKSIKVLDNLSLNVNRFKEEVAAGAGWTETLAKMVDEELAKNTQVVADETQRAATAWQNLKIAVSEFFGPNINQSFGMLTTLVNGLADAAERLKQAEADREVERLVAEVNRRYQEILRLGWRGEEIPFGLAFNYKAAIDRLAELGYDRFGVMRSVSSGPSLTGFIEEAAPTELIPDSVVQEFLDDMDIMAEGMREYFEMLEMTDEINAMRWESIKDEADASAKAIDEAMQRLVGSTLDMSMRSTVLLDEQILSWIEFRDTIVDLMADLSFAIGNELVRALTGAENAWKNFGRQIIRIVTNRALMAGITALTGGIGAVGTAAPGGFFNRLIEELFPFRPKAQGGIAKGLALVGEAGPELVEFNSRARVYSNPQTQRLMAGGMTGGEVVFRISGDELIGILSRQDEKKNYF